jgi:hypothetical protein
VPTLGSEDYFRLADQLPNDLIQHCEFYRTLKPIDCSKPVIIRPVRLGQLHPAQRAHDGQR